VTVPERGTTAALAALCLAKSIRAHWQERERPLALDPATVFQTAAPPPERTETPPSPVNWWGLLTHQRRINPVPRSVERRQCHRLRGACRHRAHFPWQWRIGSDNHTGCTAGRFPGARAGFTSRPRKSGVGTSKQKSGATGNTVDRLPPTLARVAGGEVAYAASQVLFAHADRSCASLASATPCRCADAVGRANPVLDRCHSISLKPHKGGVSRGNRQRRRQPGRYGPEASGNRKRAPRCRSALASQTPLRLFNLNHADPSARPVADRHQVRSMIARGRRTSSRVLMLIRDVLNRFCTAHPLSQQLNNGIAFWNIGPQPNTNAGSQDPLYGRDNGCRTKRHRRMQPPGSMVVGSRRIASVRSGATLPPGVTQCEVIANISGRGLSLGDAPFPVG
jgi:hypothetical protein